MRVTRRVPQPAVALETTLLLHGVPRSSAADLAARLARTAAEHGANPALTALVAGAPTLGLTDDEIRALLHAEHVPKANTANLGALIQTKQHAATTVSTTVEIAAHAGVFLFATGGLGGVHRNYAHHLDVSADLAALARFPVAVVASGVKSILDVAATREALETLGVPCVGYRCNRFPAFYQRASGAHLDATFDDPADLAAYLAAELARTARGVAVCNPVPAEHEIPAADLAPWIERAESEAAEQNITGRDVTPFVLDRLHTLSEGRTLETNIALVESNVALAAQLAAAAHRRPERPA